MCASCATTTDDIDPSTGDLKAQAESLHERLRQAVLVQRRATRETALGLAEMDRTRLYRELGYAGLAEYADRALHIGPAKSRQLALLGRRLPTLPILDQALCSGILGWTKARTISQVATPDTEQAWVERALQLSNRELEDLVADARHGAPPPDPSQEWEPPRHVWARMRLDVYHFEQFMKAVALVRHHLGEPDMSASQALLFLSEHWIDATEATDAAADSPGRGPVETQPSAHVYQDEPPEAEAAHAAHVHQDEPPGAEAAHAAHVCQDEASEAEPPQRARVYRNDRRGENAYPVNYRVIAHRCPACDRAWTEGRAGRIELHEPDRALIECDAELVAGDDSAGKAGHISRTIPPATRRAVLIRDQGRCQVPGCRGKRHLELHHLLPRAQGGGHDPQNLITLCWTHHELVHRDVLKIERVPDGSLQFQRGGGEALGLVVSIWGEAGELEQHHLADFEGPPGSWPCIAGYWGQLEPPEVPDGDGAEAPTVKQRYPHGRAVFRIGDVERMAPAWMASNIRA